MKLPFDSTAMTVYLTATGAWVAIALMFVLGAAIGSFLNVVAYRLPRGMSLSRPGSRCPACGHPIRWHDNVPIFGWLMLGGRCRDCRAAISPRYPLVELLVAIAGAAVIWAGLEPIAGAQSADAFAVEPLPLVFQLLLVDTLICAALLEFDGHRAPPRLLVAVLVAGVGLAVVWTGMLVAGETVGRALYDSATTLAAALLLGALAWPLLVHEGNDAIATGGTRVVELALVGAILGLTPLAAIAVFAQVLFVATRLAGRFWAPAARFGWAGGLVMGTLIWIVAGREIDARLPSAIRDDSLATLLAAGSIVAVLSIVVWATRPADAERSSVAGEHD